MSPPYPSWIVCTSFDKGCPEIKGEEMYNISLFDFRKIEFCLRKIFFQFYKRIDFKILIKIQEELIQNKYSRCKKKNKKRLIQIR